MHSLFFYTLSKTVFDWQTSLKSRQYENIMKVYSQGLQNGIFSYGHRTNIGLQNGIFSYGYPTNIGLQNSIFSYGYPTNTGLQICIFSYGSQINIGLQNGIFSYGYPTNIRNEFVSRMRVTSPAHPTLLVLTTITIRLFDDTEPDGLALTL